MKSANFLKNLISYTFIFIGLGFVLEWQISVNDWSDFEIPLRYFYWAFNLITLAHLVFILLKIKENNQQKKTQAFFLAIVNHFIVCLIAIGLYGFVWMKQTKAEGTIAASIYAITFVFFILMADSQAKVED